MNDKQRELLALECVVAVIGGFFIIWVASGHNGGPATYGSILIALACLGLVDGTNPDGELNKRRFILIISTGVFWVFCLIQGYQEFVGPLSAYLSPVNFISWVGFFVWALIVSIASRPISAFVVRAFNAGAAPIERVTKMAKSLALLVGACGAVWAAVAKLGQGGS